MRVFTFMGILGAILYFQYCYPFVYLFLSEGPVVGAHVAVHRLSHTGTLLTSAADQSIPMPYKMQQNKIYPPHPSL